MSEFIVGRKYQSELTDVVIKILFTNEKGGLIEYENSGETIFYNNLASRYGWKLIPNIEEVTFYAVVYYFTLFNGEKKRYSALIEEDAIEYFDLRTDIKVVYREAITVPIEVEE